MEYTPHQVEIRQTDEYAAWFEGLRDRQARARVLARIRRLSLGGLGDVRPVGDGVFELRAHHGPDYRVYFVRKGARLMILLVGGDKRTQVKDIEKARQLARDLED